MPPTAEKRLFAISLTVLLGGAAAILFCARGPSAPLVSGDACVLAGSFSAKGIYPSTVAEDPSHAGEPAFGTWSGSGPHAGSFASAMFRAPRLLNFCVAGYPLQDGMSLYLED